MVSKLPKLLCLVTRPLGLWVSLGAILPTHRAAFVGAHLGDYSVLFEGWICAIPAFPGLRLARGEGNKY